MHGWHIDAWAHLNISVDRDIGLSNGVSPVRRQTMNVASFSLGPLAHVEFWPGHLIFPNAWQYNDIYWIHYSLAEGKSVFMLNESPYLCYSPDFKIKSATLVLEYTRGEIAPNQILAGDLAHNARKWHHISHRNASAALYMRRTSCKYTNPVIENHVMPASICNKRMIVISQQTINIHISKKLQWVR